VYPLVDPVQHWKSKTFKDKVVLITGASRGIGLTTAIFYARAGARLALVSRKLQALEESKAAVLKEQPDTLILLIPADVADPKAAQNAVNKTIETYGSLDILITNAGYTTPMDHCEYFDVIFIWAIIDETIVLGEKDIISWWYTQEVNVRGVVNYIQ
jgi:NAD(P)-dependent dehydrogenase (short-subunit alcohol dehydrogenase family)